MQIWPEDKSLPFHVLCSLFIICFILLNFLCLVYVKMEESPLLRGSNCRAKGAAPGFKVAILGASGGIGQPLALLMKMNPLVSVLHLYDVVNTPGVTADISHMNTGAVVCSLTLCLVSPYS